MLDDRVEAFIWPEGGAGPGPDSYFAYEVNRAGRALCRCPAPTLQPRSVLC
jgi:hypothetical protein